MRPGEAIDKASMSTIPVAMLRGVDALTPERPLAGKRDHALRLLPQFDPGDIVSAKVEAKLPDGSYKVLIGSQSLRMVLPDGIAPEDTLELEFITRDARLTFVLKSVTQAGGTPAPQLSATGRLLAATMLPTGAAAAPLAASGASPLLAAPPANGVGLSGALAQTLAQSGLFYESHQAQWVAGSRDLAQLRQEPQARLTQAPMARERAAQFMASAGKTALEPAALAVAKRSEPSIDARTIPIVQQQLAALDAARCVLQVEIWPGQWMQWEIEDEAPGMPHTPDEQQTWKTALKLELPQLGSVRANLVLGAQGLLIQLAADDPQSTAVLRQQRGDLAQALDAAGLPAAIIAVAQHEPV